MFRKNTAGQFLTVGLVSTTDGSNVTGATITVRRCIDGTFGDGGGTVTEDANGFYKYAMAQADTNGNNIGFHFRATGAVSVNKDIVTTAANPTDVVRFGLTALPNAAADAAGGLPISDAGGLDMDAQRSDVSAILVDTGTTLDGRIPAALVSGRIDASVGAMAANVVTAAAVANGAIDAATFAAGAIDAAALAADASTEINAAVLAILGTPAGASMSADIAAVKVDTAAILVDTGTTLDGKIDTIDTVVDAILVDTGTTLDGRIPAALTAGGNMKSDALAISGSTAAADALEESTEAIGYGTVDGTGATTTVFLSSALTPDSAVNDQFNGRVLIFKSDTTTAALRGQATTITDYAHTSGEVGTFTVTALTDAPQTGDTFAIL